MRVLTARTVVAVLLLSTPSVANFARSERWVLAYATPQEGSKQKRKLRRISAAGTPLPSGTTRPEGSTNTLSGRSALASGLTRSPPSAVGSLRNEGSRVSNVWPSPRGHGDVTET